MSAYGREVWIVEKLIGKLGRDVVDEAYFEGDIEAMTKLRLALDEFGDQTLDTLPPRGHLTSDGGE